MKIIIKLLCCVFVLYAYEAGAVDEDVIGRDLRGYEPSYFSYVFDTEEHVEFKVSIKYPMLEWPNAVNVLYFAYTGKYDFYVSSNDSGRESSPVISRLQNPGLFIKHEIASDVFKYYTIGWFHESNGQQITDNQTFANTPHAEDFVSRGWDYLGVDLKFSWNSLIHMVDEMSFYTRLRFFCGCQAVGLIDGKEDDISIFGLPGKADIRDYDGLRLIVRYDNSPWNAVLELRTGISEDEALENWSYQLGIGRRVGKCPFKIFYFNGYGENISTYHLKSDYIGVGLEFW